MNNEQDAVPIWEQKLAIKNVNKWISNWIKKSPYISGAYQFYKYKDDKACTNREVLKGVCRKAYSTSSEKGN